MRKTIPSPEQYPFADLDDDELDDLSADWDWMSKFWGGVHRNTVRRWIERGLIPGPIIFSGKIVRFSKAQQREARARAISAGGFSQKERKPGYQKCKRLERERLANNEGSALP